MSAIFPTTQAGNSGCVLMALVLALAAFGGGSAAGQQPQRHEPKTEIAKPPTGESPAGKHGMPPGESKARETRQILQSATPVRLSPEQRQKIAGLVGRTPKQQRLFPVTLGAAVPKQVPLFGLPPGVADALHGFTGDKYLVMRDQLIIVDPQVGRVVAIIPVKG